jgi:hypothetical protein
MRDEAARRAGVYLDRQKPDELVDSIELLVETPAEVRLLAISAGLFSDALRHGAVAPPDAYGLDCLSATVNLSADEVDRAADMIIRFASVALATPASAVLARVGLELGGVGNDPDPSNGIAFLSIAPVHAWELHWAALDASQPPF